MIGVTAAGRAGTFRVNPYLPGGVSGAPLAVRHGSVTDKTVSREALPTDKTLDGIPVSTDNGCNVAR